MPFQVEVWNQNGRFVGPTTVDASTPKRAALEVMRSYGRRTLAAGGTPLMVNVKSPGSEHVKHYLWGGGGNPPKKEEAAAAKAAKAAAAEARRAERRRAQRVEAAAAAAAAAEAAATREKEAVAEAAAIMKTDLQELKERDPHNEIERHAILKRFAKKKKLIVQRFSRN